MTMKFTDGHWHMRPGVTAHCPVHVHEVRAEADALTVYGPTRRLTSRADTVDTALLTVRFSSPMADVIHVQMWHHKHGWVLGQIEKLERRSTLSIDKAYQITNGDEVDFEERISATVAVIGYRDDNNLLQAPRAPFKAGTKVYRAVDKLIMDVLGLKETKAGAYIGMLSGHDIKVFMDINELVQKHASILAKTGGGSTTRW